MRRELRLAWVIVLTVVGVQLFALRDLLWSGP